MNLLILAHYRRRSGCLRKPRLSFARFFALSCCAVLAACQPALMKSLSKADDYRVRDVLGQPFLHRVVEKGVSAKSDSAVLHVYIEGDGRPWVTPRQVALDPTPRELPVLALMTLDSEPSIYLGRPCYFRLVDSACDAQWWTHRRYAQEVVDSLNHVLDRYRGRYQALRLIGHSGGGSLAMLMASQRDDVDAVITLAANLNTQRWAQAHGYSELIGSLNPNDFPLPNSIRQLHFVGANDKVVPWQLVRQSLRDAQSLGLHDTVSFTVLPNIDHSCCWKTLWPTILESIKQ